MTRSLVVSLSLMGVALAAPQVRAVDAQLVGHSRGGSCAPSGCASAAYAETCAAPTQSYQCVEKTIMVPTMVKELRNVNVTEYRHEPRVRTYTVNRMVPETKTVVEHYTVNVPETRTRTENYVVNKAEHRQVTREFTVNVPYKEVRHGTRKVCTYVPVNMTRTVMVPQTRSRTETYTVCKPVTRQETREYTVNVPHKEQREGSRRVCRWVPVKETRTVRQDCGHYQDVQCAVQSGCGSRGVFRRRCCSAPCDSGCAPACEPTYVTKRVWVPNCVEKQVEVVVNRPTTVEEPYSYWVTVCKPEVRTKTITVCDTINVPQTREVQYCVNVPTEQSYTVNKPTTVDEPFTYEVTLCKQEVRSRVDTICVMVPETHSREVPYTVCVPQPRTRTRQVTTYHCEPEQRTQTYTVCVPYTVTRQIEVNVCHMVPKTITVQVPVCHACPVYTRGCCK